MNRLLLAIVFSVFYCFLLAAAYTSASARHPEPEPIQWWATPWPQNPRLIEVKVLVRDGYCVEPSLPFYVDYLDRQGQRLGTLRGEFEIRQRRMCAGTYILYYEVESPAAKTGEGHMQWTLTDGPRPFGSRKVEGGG